MMMAHSTFACTGPRPQLLLRTSAMEAIEFLDAIHVELDGALGAVMHALPDGIVLVDSEGIVVFVNERLEELSRYGSEDLIGRPIELLIPPGVRSFHEEHRHDFQADAGRRPMGAGLDVRLRPRDGAEIPVDVQLSPIRVGSSSYVIAAVRDNREQGGCRSAATERGPFPDVRRRIAGDDRRHVPERHGPLGQQPVRVDNGVAP